MAVLVDRLGVDSRPLVMPEAGGDCAYSTFSFLPDGYKKRVVAVDERHSALKFWEALGVRTACTNTRAGMVLPTDEYYRVKNKETSPLSWGEFGPDVIHNKSLAYMVLRDSNLKNVLLPDTVVDVVVRKNMSSGGKGTQMPRQSPDPEDVIITKKVIGLEYVIDVHRFENTRLSYPRITHDVVNGRDTYCTLLGPRHELYTALHEATMEVCNALGIVGVANVQLIASTEGGHWVRPRFYFVEAALRLSGSSWLNGLVGANPLIGTRGEDFSTTAVSTRCGYNAFPLY